MSELAVGEFNSLEFEKKASIVWHRATFLAKRLTPDHRINLYHLDGFYVQLWYNLHLNRIEEVSATLDGNVVDPYLDSISYEDINENLI